MTTKLQQQRYKLHTRVRKFAGISADNYAILISEKKLSELTDRQKQDIDALKKLGYVIQLEWI